jgi:hypothetical protein
MPPHGNINSAKHYIIEYFPYILMPENALD